MEKLFFDTECYANYFLIIFKSEKGKITVFEKTETEALDIVRLRKTIGNKLVIGFNSKMYDIPMVTYAMRGIDNYNLKNMSNLLIPDKELLKAGIVKSSYDVITDNGLWQLENIKYDHIDIMHVAPGKCSLKLYGARIGSVKLQDLPYDHTKPLSREQMNDVRDYCVNDIKITEDLFKKLHEEFAVREDLNKEFGIDSRSKSNAQIAELVIGKYCSFDPDKIKSDVKFKFNSSLDFKFKNEDLVKLKSDLEDVEFEAKRYSKIKCEKVHRTISINGTEYNFGIGGLHSTEKGRSLIAKDDEQFIDVDVSSCYPKIILNNNLFPPQIEDGFLKIYNQFYNERLNINNSDNPKSKVLKIILNGSFGKFGDGYSNYLYAPELLINTTITGQLCLLLLIERLEEHGFKTLSANTDGIVIKVPKSNYKDFKKILEAWKTKFKYDTKEVVYRALHSHSVNSYIAIKEDGTIKSKGLFADNDLSRNIYVPICKKAVIHLVSKCISIQDTIRNMEQYPLDLILMRKTKDGAYWKGNYLGFTVRWYWSTKGESITNFKGHKIAETNDAYPLMDLREPIRDLHYDKYVDKAYELLKLIGVN